GTRQVVSMVQKSVVGVSMTDGKLLWQYPWVSRMTPSAITPIIYKDTILVSSQDMGITALRQGTKVWETKDISLFMSNPVLVGDTLFGLSHRASGQFFALDASTGKTLWLGPPREATNAAFVKSRDLLFILKDNAELIVARAGRTGFETLKRYTVA